MEINDIEDIDLFCERQGFDFHTNGRGKWGMNPYWSMNGVSYVPADNTLKVESECGTFIGRPKSKEHFLALISAMQIDVSSLKNELRSKENAEKCLKQKMALANRVANQIEIQFGYRHEKCLHMAIQGEWWERTNRLSQMSNRIVGTISAAVIEDINTGKIK